MFLHTENQKLLWQTLQKSPYLVEFSQKFAGHRDEWFRGVIEQFYTQWISQNNPLPSNARELLEINKLALQTMVTDLKRLLGYPSQRTQPSVEPNSYDVRPYDVAAERKNREDTFSENFNKYQSEYNRLLERPDLPMKALPTQSGGEKIKNMEELVKEQARLRDMDLTIYTPAPTVSPKREEPVKSVIKLNILDEIENVHDEIENVHFDSKMVRFDLQDREDLNENEYSSASQ